ncbi:RDD family protein [Bermanella sp. R86510]|uniref:RDD family protein n=1 Tax=unclassified Bermanella TaxID=2627862 RepID=UPI0037C749E9
MNTDTSNTLTVTPASPQVRLAAFLYDTLLIVALWFVIGGIAVVINGGEGLSPNNPFMPSMMFVTWVWFNLHFWRRGGQTLGMRAWRLRLHSTTGKPLTLIQGMLRLLVAIPSLGLAGLGYFWVWFDKDKLAWHDRYSETKVMREPKS